MLRHIDADWKTPVCIPYLGKNCVHLWRVNLDSLGEEPGLLSSHEREKLSKYRNASDRSRKSAARVALRKILACYVNVPPADIRLEYDLNGKPVLLSSQNFADVRFNLSHSYGTALIGFCRGEQIGVDLERVDPDFPAAGILERFSRRGLFAFESPDPKTDVTSFYRLWTRNEAYVKGSGLGLAGLAALHFDDRDNPRGSLSDAVGHWSIISFEMGTDFVGALATTSPSMEVLFLNYADRKRSVRRKKNSSVRNRRSLW
jgi:4'-phosphopantetheinyl transferase